MDNLIRAIEQIEKSQDVATYGQMGRKDIEALTSALRIIQEEIVQINRRIRHITSNI